MSGEPRRLRALARATRQTNPFPKKEKPMDDTSCRPQKSGRNAADRFEKFIVGARGGNRTRTPFGNSILSAERLPIPPPAQDVLSYFYHDVGTKGHGNQGKVRANSPACYRNGHH